MTGQRAVLWLPSDLKLLFSPDDYILSNPPDVQISRLRLPLSKDFGKAELST
jgi:hypothetical protein